MNSANLILAAIACVCFLLGAAGYPENSRVNVVSLGLLFLTLALIIR